MAIGIATILIAFVVAVVSILGTCREHRARQLRRDRLAIAAITTGVSVTWVSHGPRQIATGLAATT